MSHVIVLRGPEEATGEKHFSVRWLILFFTLYVPATDQHLVTKADCRGGALFKAAALTQ